MECASLQGSEPNPLQLQVHAQPKTQDNPSRLHFRWSLLHFRWRLPHAKNPIVAHSDSPRNFCNSDTNPWHSQPKISDIPSKTVFPMEFASTQRSPPKFGPSLQKCICVGVCLMQRIPQSFEANPESLRNFCNPTRTHAQPKTLTEFCNRAAINFYPNACTTQNSKRSLH